MATLAELNEATVFERYALDAATPLIKPQYGWVDLRSSPGSVGAILGTINTCAEALDRLRLQIRPLMFGAAWKILDLVVEYALPPWTGRGRYWPISCKLDRAVNQVDLTPWPPFTPYDAEWIAALRMYANTYELRHGLIHRRQGLTIDRGSDEQIAFCRASRRLIGAILSGSIHPRERDDLAFQLAQVHRYSGVTPQSRDELRWVCEIHINLIDCGGGVVELDVARLDHAMEQQRESHRAFDLVAYLPGSSEVGPLIGKLEGAPLDRPSTRFSRDDLPNWLSRDSQRRTLLS